MLLSKRKRSTDGGVACSWSYVLTSHASQLLVRVERTRRTPLWFALLPFGQRQPSPHDARCVAALSWPRCRTHRRVPATPALLRRPLAREQLRVWRPCGTAELPPGAASPAASLSLGARARGASRGASVPTRGGAPSRRARARALHGASAPSRAQSGSRSWCNATHTQPYSTMSTRADASTNSKQDTSAQPASQSAIRTMSRLRPRARGGLSGSA